MTRLGDAARLRLGTLALVAALVLALRALAPDPGMRRDSLLWVALGLGYGHQLGALRFARPRRSKLDWLLSGTTTLTAALLFALALASDAAAWLLVGLALLAAWHVLENDVALGRARPGSRRLPPLSRRPWPHLVTLGIAGAVVSVALLAPGSAPHWVAVGVPAWLAAWTPEEVIAVLLLYHSAVWLVRALAHTAGAGAASSAGRAPILLTHALPLLALAGASALAPAAFAWFASPPAYLFLSAAHRPHLPRARLRSGVIPGVLQIVAWCAAFWLALWLHARTSAEPREHVRFALALGAGALLARAGHSLLWGDPGRMLEPGEEFSILFFPLGVFWLAPHAAAFASLPLALALARLGCLPAGCCRGVSGEPLPLFEAGALCALQIFLARSEPERVAERFAFVFGGLRFAQAPWRPAVGTAVATPELVALAWIGFGALLQVARHRRATVTKAQRFPHASPTPGGAS